MSRFALSICIAPAMFLLSGAIVMLLSGNGLTLEFFQERLTVLAFVLGIFLFFGASYAVIAKLERPLIGWGMVISGVTILVFTPWWGA